MNIKIGMLSLAMCLAAGCSVLEPRPDNSRFFILTPVSNPAPPAPATANNSEMSIGVGPIEFPDYLRRQQVVTRSSPNKLVLSEERRWGEPLDRNFSRVLCENLAQLMSAQRIEKYPWSRKNPVDYQVTIDVQRFETSADGFGYLSARWSIKDGQSGKDLYRSQTLANEPVGPEESAPSAALSNDLAVLSRDISTQLTILEQTRTRSAKLLPSSVANSRTANAD